MPASTSSRRASSRPSRTARSMLSRRVGQVGDQRGRARRAAARAANSAHCAHGLPVVHCTLVCCGLVFFSPDPGAAARRTPASASAALQMGARGSARVLRTAAAHGSAPAAACPAGQVLGDLGLPGLDRAGGVDLELEPRHHVLGDVLDVHVELLVPAAQLVDRAVLGAQQRVVDRGSCASRSPRPAGTRRRCSWRTCAATLSACSSVSPGSRLTITPHCSTNEVGRDRVVAVDQDGLDVEAVVVVPQVVDHVRRAVVRRPPSAA